MTQPTDGESTTPRKSGYRAYDPYRDMQAALLSDPLDALTDRPYIDGWQELRLEKAKQRIAERRARAERGEPDDGA